MEINKIFTKNVISKVNKWNGLKKFSQNLEDKINLSRDCKKIKENQRYIDIVKKAPDVRQDKINEVREKIKAGNYFESVDLEEVAERIMNPHKDY